MTTATKVVIKPLEDRIVVRPLEAEQTTASGLVIPDTAKEKPQEGKVLAVGPGRFDDAGAKRAKKAAAVGRWVIVLDVDVLDMWQERVECLGRKIVNLMQVRDVQPKSESAAAEEVECCQHVVCGGDSAHRFILQ